MQRDTTIVEMAELKAISDKLSEALEALREVEQRTETPRTGDEVSRGYADREKASVRLKTVALVDESARGYLEFEVARLMAEVRAEERASWAGPPSIVDALTAEAEKLGQYPSELPKTATQTNNGALAVASDEAADNGRLAKLEAAFSKFMSYTRAGHGGITEVPDWQLDELAEAFRPDESQDGSGIHAYDREKLLKGEAK